MITFKNHVVWCETSPLNFLGRWRFLLTGEELRRSTGFLWEATNHVEFLVEIDEGGGKCCWIPHTKSYEWSNKNKPLIPSTLWFLYVFVCAGQRQGFFFRKLTTSGFTNSMSPPIQGATLDEKWYVALALQSQSSHSKCLPEMMNVISFWEWLVLVAPWANVFLECD